MARRLRRAIRSRRAIKARRRRSKSSRFMRRFKRRYIGNRF